MEQIIQVDVDLGIMVMVGKLVRAMQALEALVATIRLVRVVHLR
jgi:hypothetical protein